MSTIPRQGPGRFQWNTWAWFGAQVGSTLWMLILGIMYCFKDLTIAGIVLGCFLAANAIGLGMWLRRDQLLPYPAIQVLILVIGLATAAIFITLDFFGILVGFGTHPYLLLVLFPGLLLRFYLQESHALKMKEREAGEPGQSET